jgi:oligopeptide/dipeptide ABC transporter ATP-binding protein
MVDPTEVMRKHPHQLSGGMQQRVMIAQALMGDPELLIADEPTTALDVTIQAEILQLLRRLQKDRNMSCVLITHDMGVASEMADRIAVLYAGQVIEVGPTESILAHPQHAYTKALLECVPRPNVRLDGRMRTILGSVPAPGTAIAGDRFAPRNPLATTRCLTEPPPVRISADGQRLVRSWQPVEAWTQEMVDILTSWDPEAARSRSAPSDEPIIVLDGVNKTYAKGRSAFSRGPRGKGPRGDGGVRAVRDLRLTVYRGELFGLVGETGSGKSTLGKLVVDLERADPGSAINVAGFDLGAKRSHGEERELRRTIQMIFQNPQDSLDPRRTVAQAIAEPLKALTAMDKAARAVRIAEMLDAVGLPARMGERHAGELSGGQRQRVAIARALAPSPGVIVADEPTSALDVSVQGQVMNLLLDLQAEFGLTYIFITHNLSLITAVADRAGVMYRGELLEVASATELVAHPSHEYTQRLLAANPDPFARVAT